MQRVSRTIKELRDVNLLFRNTDYLAVSKPEGLSAIVGRKPNTGIVQLLNSMELLSEESTVPVPIHTMDADTTGVLLMSRHEAAGKLARSMIKNGHFWRCKYWGILNRRISGRAWNGIINIPLLDGRPSSDGIPSITHWRVLKCNDLDGGMSLVEFEPRTDVKDQIRIHCGLSLNAELDGPLHLASVSVSLPGGELLDIRAPTIGRMKDTMLRLGWG